MNDKINELRRNAEKAACFFMKSLAYTLGPVELKNMVEQEKAVVVDVRAHEDYITSHIPGALSIPKSELANRLQELSKDKITVVYCYNQQCHLGASACLTLADYEYPCMLMEGGFDVWVNNFRFATVSGEN